MRTIHSSFCTRLSHAPWSLMRASSSMMSHSLCTHAVMLAVFNLVSTTPRFHHPLCLGARPLTLTSLLGAASSIPSSASGFPCSFSLRLAFPQKTVFPTAETVAHIQSAGCKAQKKSVIGAHNRCWKYLLGAISKHWEAKRDVEFIWENKDRQLESLRRETRIGDGLPWEDIADEAQRLLDINKVSRNDQRSRRWRAGKRPRSRSG